MKIFMMVLTCVVVLSCLSREKHSEEAKDKTEILSQNDPRVKRAIALAQDSLPFFIETFHKLYDQEAYNFFVKTKLGNTSEHLWAKPFKVSNKQFTCILDSNPNIPGYRFGDTIQVHFDSVEDYMIILGDSVIGNYLQRELKKVSR